jgi:hypothetical protein
MCPETCSYVPYMQLLFEVWLISWLLIIVMAVIAA